MPDYTTLMGADQVQSAGRAMQSAAEQMSRAANQIDDVFHRQRMFMDDWLARFEAAMEKNSG